MNCKFLVFSLLALVSFGLFGMDPPESHKRKREITPEDLVQFLQKMKQNHTTVENNFMQLLTTDLENIDKKDALINRLVELASQDFNSKIRFLKRLPEPAKKKPKVESIEKQGQIKAEDSGLQNKKKLQDPDLMAKILTTLIKFQQTSIHTAQGNVDLLKSALQAIQSDKPPKKDEKPYSLMYI